MGAPEILYGHETKGGQYRCLGVANLKETVHERWRACILYQDVVTGAFYVTGPERWNAKFGLLPRVAQDAGEEYDRQ